MKIRKFVAAAMPQAVALVKRELGPEAMIIATRSVRRGLLGSGVEVTAAIDIDEPEVEAAAAPPPPPGRGGLSDADVERVLLPLRSELRTLRTMLRPQGERVLDEELRGELHAIRQSLAGLRPVAATTPVIDRQRLAAPSTRRLVALVGPTGVGKTTTIAKLAARAALIERRAVAMVTLDSYRVGGEEQARTFADLIGIPLAVVVEPARLAATIADLGARDRVFIDTAGRSPRDGDAFATLERAFAGLDDLEVHLAVAAGSPPPLVDGWFRRLSRLPIHRLLFTKLDEAIDLVDLACAPARLDLPISWITTGQRVPEDLEEATAERLLELVEQGLFHREVAA